MNFLILCEYNKINIYSSFSDSVRSVRVVTLYTYPYNIFAVNATLKIIFNFYIFGYLHVHKVVSLCTKFLKFAF